ncbi:RHS repeat-associated core domain-containing protein [Pseudomonas asplenii]|uniref:RHS repeat-associated core domain-containing protein n=1 Tax=Pseudomonas asplenii TaxID=53407 RepID=UPI0006CD6867|nr:RHS repeat-associated core domain-containing protein [Pseudomonas fuscovaginae]KPA97221.1 RHS repeat-associated core domain [Pseudomonas fuscovaginae]
MATVLILSQYRYDPLDRLVACAPTNLAPHQRFYCKSRLATEIQGAVAHTFFLSDTVLLAQQRRQGAGRETNLLATDQQGSVLQALDRAQHQAMVYSPYGHRAPANGLSSLLGFNGERAEPVTGHYLLGNGYRAFNPVLMRFNSPDRLSPFDEGGLNGYAYVQGDPINAVDSTGHLPEFINKVAVRVGALFKKKDVWVHNVHLGVFSEREINGLPESLRRPTELYVSQRPLPFKFSTDEIEHLDEILARESREIIKLEALLADSYVGNEHVKRFRVLFIAKVDVMRKEYRRNMGKLAFEMQGRGTPPDGREYPPDYFELENIRLA